MTSRERLLTALHHREPDRIPLDLASTQVTGIALKAYEHLCDFLGISPEGATVCDRIQQIVIPHDSFLDTVGVDTRGLWPLTSHNDFTDEDEGDTLAHLDEWGLGYRMNKDEALYYNLYLSPLADRELTPGLVDSYSWPDGDDPKRFAGLREQAQTFRQAGYAVVLKSVCAGLLEMAIRLRGMENFLVDLMLDTDTAALVLDKILQVKKDYFEAAIRELGDLVDVYAEADDYGTQTSQLISGDIYRELLKPRQADLFSLIRKRAPDAAVFFHSCGNVRPLIPDFIEIGVDILNPVHVTAAGMEPAQLKRDFGTDIVFWGGGVESQNVLPYGTPAEVRDNVRRNIEALAPGGGYVFNTIHNIQADVPLENIMAMYDALGEFGTYG